jgi:hypothetical protein
MEQYQILKKVEKMEIIGDCPICNREMYKGDFVDKHHFHPKCKGGKETEYLHRICHRKIHSLFTENELAKEYNNAEMVKIHPEIIKFVKWVSKKDPNFYDSTVTHNRKRRK